MRQSPQSHSRIPSPWAALLSWKKTTCPWPAAVHEQNPSSYEAWSEKCPDATTHSRYWWQLPNSHMASQGEVEIRLRNSSRIHNQQWTARAALPLCQHHDVWRHSGQNLSCLASSQLAVGLLSPALCQARSGTTAQAASATASIHSRWATRQERAYEATLSTWVSWNMTWPSRRKR